MRPILARPPESIPPNSPQSSPQTPQSQTAQSQQPLVGNRGLQISQGLAASAYPYSNPQFQTAQTQQTFQEPCRLQPSQPPTAQIQPDPPFWSPTRRSQQSLPVSGTQQFSQFSAAPAYTHAVPQSQQHYAVTNQFQPQHATALSPQPSYIQQQQHAFNQWPHYQAAPQGSPGPLNQQPYTAPTSSQYPNLPGQHQQPLNSKVPALFPGYHRADVPSSYPPPSAGGYDYTASSGDWHTKYASVRDPPKQDAGSSTISPSPGSHHTNDALPSRDITPSIAGRSPSPSASSPCQSDVSISLDAARTEFESATSKARSESRDDSESEFENGDNTIEGNDGYISDADSDYLEFKNGLEKLKENIRNLKEQGDCKSSSQRRKRGKPSGGRGRWQGPRKAAEPTGEISRRLGAAYQCFINVQYTEAKIILSEVIQINAETYEAYTLLASIAQEEGRVDDAMTSLMLAAHMRPREQESWWKCVDFALNETGDDKSHYLETARWCLSQILRNNYQNIKAHEWKAVVYRDQEKFDRVVAEYQTLLRLKPHDVEVLRQLAEACIDANKVDIAKKAYLESIEHFKAFAENIVLGFNWTDLDYYTELYAHADEYEQALKEAKALARWLRGRTEEGFWDDITTNDCEWDEDDSRRRLIPYFESNRFPAESYSLPLAIRIKFGILRLQAGYADEATRHFAMLEPAIAYGNKELLENSSLFRQAADHLHAQGDFKRALTFYEALGRIPQEKTDLLMIQMGKCFLAQNLVQEAEKSFLTAIELNENDHEARTALAELWDNNNEKEKAFAMTTEAYKYKRIQHPVPVAPPKPKGRPRKDAKDIFVKAKEKKLQPIISRPPETRPRPDIGDPHEEQRTKHLRAQYYILKDSNNTMRQGDLEATKAWMSAAQYLLDDFRTSKSIFAWDNKLVVFHGYTPAEGLHALVPLDPGLTEISERLSRNLDDHGPVGEPCGNANTAGVPTSYRGIHFRSWLEIFLEHAICLAKDGQAKASYDACEAASEANVFFRSRECMFQIYMCWSMCALISSDEAEIVKIAREIMKQHQFTTDSYRIFDVMIRMCHTPVSWYGAGPTQKFILRQIRAMDHALADEASKNGKQFVGKGSYSAVDESGQVVAIEDLNMSLLMIYGWILFTGSSFSLALNYFLRAYALDPNNPLLIFSLGLTYVHDALKRQAENRQYSIIQGLTFLHEYHEIRKQSEHAEERVEADFNLGRVYHMLGLVHLARPFYWKVLRASRQDIKEDLVFEAAYNLTNIYASSGNLELAQSITSEWLVI